MAATCLVTTWTTRIRPDDVIADYSHPCGQPVVAHGLCAKHDADRTRLQGEN